MSQSKRPTSEDVAKLAGVSRTTVSYVINNYSGNIKISKETQDKVWEAVKTLGYKPIRAARQLRTNKSNLLALMIPHIETPFHPLLASVIQQEAEENGYDVFIVNTRDEPMREKRFLDNLVSRGVDGIILQSYQVSTEDIEEVVKFGIGVVVIGNRPIHPLADNVLFDEEKAVADITQYLINKGHQRIGIIAGPQTTWAGELRMKGYAQALNERGIELDDDLIFEADFYDGESSYAAIDKYLALSDPPTAILAANDLLAIHSILRLQDLGHSVPGDFAVVGFNDTPEAKFIRPMLTTVRKDFKALGAKAVELIVDRLPDANSTPGRQVKLDYEIIQRDSA